MGTPDQSRAATPWTETKGRPDQSRAATPWTVNLHRPAYDRVRELARTAHATYTLVVLAALAEYTVTLPPPPEPFPFRSGTQCPIRVYHYDAVYPVLAKLHARRLGLSDMQFFGTLLLDCPPPWTLLTTPGALQDPELVAYLREYKAGHPPPLTGERRAPQKLRKQLPTNAFIAPEDYSVLLSMAQSTGAHIGRAAALATLVALADPPVLPAGGTLAYPRPVKARSVPLYFAGESEALAVPLPLRTFFGDSFTHAITFAVRERRPLLWDTLRAFPLTERPVDPVHLQELFSR